MLLLNALRHVARAIAIYNQRQRIASELHAYSDRELNDLGISRADIPVIARRAVG